MNYISPCNHPESYLTGSTIESMIDKTKELGLNYFTVTDIASMSSIVRGYMYAKKKDIKLIAGIEILFKDSNCDIVADTESGSIKYFKLLLHAKDQEAYQKIVKMNSNSTRQKILVRDEKLPVFNWSDLEEISKFNITACTSDLEDMVSKHLLVGRGDLGVLYYKKLKKIFKENFYLSIIPYSYDKYWENIVEITLGNKTVQVPAFDRVETDHFKRTQAIDLTKRGNKHKKILAVYINKVRYNVAPEFQIINKAKLLNDFQPMPNGDAQTRANKLILALARKTDSFDKVMINNYSYYSNEGDNVVQSMKLGETERFDQSQFMRSLEEANSYLKNMLNLSDKDIQEITDNSHTWSKNFENFELKYDYRLPDCGENTKQQLMDTIEKVGRMDWNNPIYVKQFEEELELLTNNGELDLIPYFLPIVDVYDAYKENGYLTGPARGSAGGFLISYLLGVVHIDPIKYGLYSSRFLTLDRIQAGNLPDIDVDLESRDFLVGQDGNGGYLFNKYGNKAAQISTRTLLRIKSAILDANRFVNKGKVESDIKELSKSLPTTPQGVNDLDFVFGYEKDGSHVDGLLDVNKDLAKYAEARPIEWDIVTRALSLSRQKSRHACFTAGTLITTHSDGKLIEKDIIECDGEYVVTHNGHIAKAKLLTQGNKEVFKYTFSNSSYEICTPDHLFLTINGSWVEIEKALEQGIDLYSEQNKRSKKMNVNCSKHGDRHITYESVSINKFPCRKCVDSNKKRIYWNDFKKWLKKNRNYILKSVFDEYKNNQTKLKFYCDKHGYFLQNIKNIKKYNGCLQCGIIERSQKKTHSHKYVKNIIENKTDYKLISKYQKSQKPLKLLCSKHGVFQMRFYDIQNNHGCRKCFWKESNGEKECREIFENITNKKFPNVRPDFLKNIKNKSYLELDGYNEELKLAFEYDGEQHYKAVDFFGGDVGLKKTQERDKLKDKLCKNNNIQLIRIPYFVKNKEEYIKEKINESY